MARQVSHRCVKSRRNTGHLARYNARVGLMAEPDDQIERVCKQVYRPDAKVQFAFDFRIKLVEVPYDVGHENYGQTGWHRYPEAALGLLGYFEQLFVGDTRLGVEVPVELGQRRVLRPPGKGGEGPGADLFDPGHVGHEGLQLRALLVGDAVGAGSVPVDVGQGPLALLDPVQRPREIEWHRGVLQLTSQ